MSTPLSGMPMRLACEPSVISLITTRLPPCASSSAMPRFPGPNVYWMIDVLPIGTGGTVLPKVKSVAAPSSESPRSV